MFHPISRFPKRHRDGRAPRRRELEVGLLEGRRLMSADVTPPATNIAVFGDLGHHGVYRSPVTVDLVASDPDDAPATLGTFYRVDGGAYVQGTHFTLGDGNHTIQYFSVDPAGNHEIVHTVPIDVDLTAPRVTAVANPTTLWPPNHKFVPVTISGHVTDASGALPSVVHYQVYDEYGQVQPHGFATVAPNGDYAFTVFLQSSRAGQDKDGRLYTIVVTATDEAGNSGSARTFVTVPHDQGHHNGNGNGGNEGNGNGNSNGNGHGHGNGGQGNGNSNGGGQDNGNGNGHGHGHGNKHGKND